MNLKSCSVDDLRALRARFKVLLYPLAAEIGIHPTRLGAMLNGKLPVTPDLAEKIRAAIERQAGVGVR